MPKNALYPNSLYGKDLIPPGDLLQDVTAFDTAARLLNGFTARPRRPGDYNFVTNTSDVTTFASMLACALTSKGYGLSVTRDPVTPSGEALKDPWMAIGCWRRDWNAFDQIHNLAYRLPLGSFLHDCSDQGQIMWDDLKSRFELHAENLQGSVAHPRQVAMRGYMTVLVRRAWSGPNLPAYFLNSINQYRAEMDDSCTPLSLQGTGDLTTRLIDQIMMYHNITPPSDPLQARLNGPLPYLLTNPRTN